MLIIIGDASSRVIMLIFYKKIHIYVHFKQCVTI